MMFSSGIDLVEIKRIEKSVKNEKFLNKVYSQREIEYFNKRNFPVETIAGSFCVKEAFSKAIGTGIRGFSLNEVEVLHDELGKPFLSFLGKAKVIAEKLSYTYSVSISHTSEYATAIVIAYKNAL